MEYLTYYLDVVDDGFGNRTIKFSSSFPIRFAGEKRSL